MRIHQQTIMDAIAILSANFTAATTDIITSNAHGLKKNDMVVLTTTDTLPAGLSTSTVYYVVNPTTNTFQLSTEKDGTSGVVDITDTGTGTHTFTMHDIGFDILTEDFKNINIMFNTASSANMTVKFVGSDADDCPDFSAAQSASNPWDYIDVIDKEDSSSIDGDTGIAPAGTDDNRMLVANVDGFKWFNAIITSYTAGTVTIRVRLADNS